MKIPFKIMAKLNVNLHEMYNKGHLIVQVKKDSKNLERIFVYFKKQ